MAPRSNPRVVSSTTAIAILSIATACTPLKDPGGVDNGTSTGASGASQAGAGITTTTTTATTAAASTTGGTGGRGVDDPPDGASATTDGPWGAGGADGQGRNEFDGGSGGVVRVSVGGSHTCAVLQSGGVRCWGWGAYGMPGYGNRVDIGDDETPASVGDVNVGGKVVDVTVGTRHACALLEGGRVRCWGFAFEGELGYGNQTDVGDDGPPAAAGDVAVGGTVVQIAAGLDHTCALLDTGNVRCWGSNAAGQIGYANTRSVGDNELPFTAGDVNVGGRVIQISTGYQQTCALLEGGAVRCWGQNAFGALGYGHQDNIGDDEAPAHAGNVDVGGPVAQLTVGSQITCTLLVGGRVRCWGSSAVGQLGYGNTKTIGDDEVPASAGDVDVGGKVVQVSAGFDHVCALLDTGHLRCWGRNEVGQLGYGNTTTIGDNETPSSAGDVDVGGTVTRISTGSGRTCAILEGGRLRCWGADGLGGLGYGRPLGGPIGDDETPASVGDVPVF
jgi:alpha-tubulin suppressor-like RCC1 family protein